MSENIRDIHDEDEQGVDLEPAAHAAAERRRERGMITIEYAVGGLMVIALIAAIVLAINQGDFMTTLVPQFATFISQQIQSALQAKP